VNDNIKAAMHRIDGEVPTKSVQDTGPLTNPRAAQGQLTPEMAIILNRITEAARHVPAFMQIPAEQARTQYAQSQAYWNEVLEQDVTIRRIGIPVATGMMDAVRISPRRSDGTTAGTLLYMHGGGWVVGSIDTHLGLMARLAATTGQDVVGINYGLAPEAPFPGGLNDCLAAWHWLRANSPPLQLESPWFVGGDSAGANLALALLLELRDAGESLPDSALLFYGVYAADNVTESHRLSGQGQFGLSSEKMAWFRNHYLNGSTAKAQSPCVAPLAADLHGLPPLLITAAEFDCLHDDSIALAQRAADAGVQFELIVYAGVIHGFMQMSRELPAAVTAFEDVAAFIQSRRHA
jgi:acetyl esterase/lipase